MLVNPDIGEEKSYTEASAAKSPVHIYLPDELDYLKSLTDKGIKVYLMHLDDEDKAYELMASGKCGKVAVVFPD